MTDYSKSAFCRNRKISFLINSLSVGGSEKVCVTLSNELIKRGYKVDIIVVNPHTPLETKLHKDVKLIKLGFQRIYRSSFSVINKCRNIDTDSLMVFDPELYVLAFASKVIFGRRFKLIFRCYNTLSRSFENSSTRYKIFNKPLIKVALRFSETIIAQSSGMKADLVGNFNVDESNIIVIPNPAIVLDDCQELFPKENVILFVGRIAPQKGLKYLFSAFQIVVKAFPKYRMLVVGNGDDMYVRKIKRLAVEMEISSHICFEGSQKNIAKYYKIARVTALSSLFEGFPNVLVESISLGTPVVSFDCQSGPADIIQNQVNGILVPMLNVEELATAIKSIIESPLKKEAIIKSSEKFALENIATRYVKVLTNNK